MEIDVRPFDGEPRAFLEAAELAFGERARDEDVPVWESTFEPDRAIGAYDGDRLVGTAGALSLDLTIPGGVVPSAGVTIVGVHPTHRRRGILRRMMRFQLDQVRDRGEATAILWASEGSIYQRFGYGLATTLTRLSIERERSAFRRPHEPAGTIRFVEVDERSGCSHPSTTPSRRTARGSSPARRPSGTARSSTTPSTGDAAREPPSTSSTRSTARSTATRATAFARGPRATARARASS